MKDEEGEKSENNKSDYVQIEWVEKKELEEVVKEIVLAIYTILFVGSVRCV